MALNGSTLSFWICELWELMTAVTLKALKVFWVCYHVRLYKFTDLSKYSPYPSKAERKNLLHESWGGHGENQEQSFEEQMRKISSILRIILGAFPLLSLIFLFRSRPALSVPLPLARSRTITISSCAILTWFSPYDLLVFSEEGSSIFARNGRRFLPNYNGIDRNSVQVSSLTDWSSN